MGLRKNIAQSIIDNVTSSLRHFTAFVFLLFAAGVVMGMHVSRLSTDYQILAVAAPIGLAALSFVWTDFAVVVFILVALLIFIL